METVRLGYNRSSMRKGLIMIIVFLILGLGAFFHWINE